MERWRGITVAPMGVADYGELRHQTWIPYDLYNFSHLRHPSGSSTEFYNFPYVEGVRARRWLHIHFSQSLASSQSSTAYTASYFEGNLTREYFDPSPWNRPLPVPLHLFLSFYVLFRF
jgi:hypothetical protein